MKVYFLTADDARYGFKLAGMSQIVTTAAETEQIIGRLIAAPDTGLVVVDERLLSDTGDQRFRAMERRWAGLVVTLPAPAGGVAGDEYLMALVRRAIGYHVRLQP